MKKSGLTLLETLLTAVLLSILLAGLFSLSHSQKKTIDLMQDNNFALFTLESLKNKALHYNDNLSLESNLKPSFYRNIIDEDRWKINFKLEEQTLFITTFKKKKNKTEKRRYIKKVDLTYD
ncbi:MAG: hypothetical protein ACQETH_15045 [Candidatus Rifleibacteriota bacterium]